LYIEKKIQKEIKRWWNNHKNDILYCNSTFDYLFLRGKIKIKIIINNFRKLKKIENFSLFKEN
jgi:hypothetical protein